MRLRRTSGAAPKQPFAAGKTRPEAALRERPLPGRPAAAPFMAAGAVLNEEPTFLRTVLLIEVLRASSLSRTFE
jgi:hypothetical protein